MPVTVYDEPDGDMPQEVVRVLVPGVKFELYNDSEEAVVSPETGKLVEPATACAPSRSMRTGLPPPRTTTPT